MNSLIEAHFTGIPSQSSIYGLTPLFTGESSHKMLVASSKRKVYCIEYSKNQQRVIFSTREVQFTYIPGGAEIISIDAFNQACHVHDFVVGITFTKVDHNSMQNQYFNIYSDWEPSNECDLIDNIAQGCLSICLDFIPFHLTHTELSVDEEKEMVWLLSGSDNKIHLYREDKSRQTYEEDLSNTCFPEFGVMPSVVLWMDFFTTEESRLTALGCKDGSILVSSVKFKPDIHIEGSWVVQHDGPVCSVKLFQDSDLDGLSNHPLRRSFPNRFNLFVGNTLEVSVVYRDILKHGLELANQRLLPSSNKFDCVTHGIIADIDMDGNNELILGTYGQQLLVYKWKQETRNNIKGSYVLHHKRTFSYPLLAMSYTDVIGDGVKDLLVLTTKGLHILQHDLKKTAELCISRMKWVLQNVPEDELEKYLKSHKV